MKFRASTGSIASIEQSPVKDVVSDRSTSAGKRKVGDTTIGTMHTKNAEKSSKRRKVSVYDAVAGE